jgi:hypothetical protein
MALLLKFRNCMEGVQVGSSTDEWSRGGFRGARGRGGAAS